MRSRKSKLRLEDFLNAAATMGLDEKVVLRLVDSLKKALPKWQQLIRDSFLSDDMKKEYEALILSRLNRL